MFSADAGSRTSACLFSGEVQRFFLELLSRDGTLVRERAGPLSLFSSAALRCPWEERSPWKHGARVSFTADSLPARFFHWLDLVSVPRTVPRTQVPQASAGGVNAWARGLGRRVVLEETCLGVLLLQHNVHSLPCIQGHVLASFLFEGFISS